LVWLSLLMGTFENAYCYPHYLSLVPRSPFQPIRCLRFETGFQTKFYNLQPWLNDFLCLMRWK
jgi:hypothetical protein